MAKLCGRCGEKTETGRHIYSKYTKNYYCWDIDACEDRAKKKKAMTLEEITRKADALRKELDINGFETV